MRQKGNKKAEKRSRAKAKKKIQKAAKRVKMTQDDTSDYEDSSSSSSSEGNGPANEHQNQTRRRTDTITLSSDSDSSGNETSPTASRTKTVVQTGTATRALTRTTQTARDKRSNGISSSDSESSGNETSPTATRTKVKGLIRKGENEFKINSTLYPSQLTQTRITMIHDDKNGHEPTGPGRSVTYQQVAFDKIRARQKKGEVVNAIFNQSPDDDTKRPEAIEPLEPGLVPTNNKAAIRLLEAEETMGPWTLGETLRPNRYENSPTTIKPGSVTVTELRTLEELRQVEEQVETGDYAALLYPLVCWDSQQQDNTTVEHEAMAAKAVYRRARAFFLTKEIHEEFRAKLLKSKGGPQVWSTNKGEDIFPRISRWMRHNPTGLDTEAVEVYSASEPEEGSDDEGNVTKIFRLKYNEEGEDEVGKYYPNYKVFRKAELASDPSVATADHPDSTRSRESGTEPQTLATIEHLDVAENETPGCSHMILLGPTTPTLKSSLELARQSQKTKTNWAQRRSRLRRMEQISNSQIVDEIPAYRGVLAPVRFHSGALHVWEPLISEIKATKTYYVITSKGTIESRVSGEKIDLQANHYHVLRVSPLNNLDLLVMQTANDMVTVPFVVAFDEICQIRDEIIWARHIHPLKFLDSNTKEWASREPQPEVVPSLSMEDPRATKITIDRVLEVDEGKPGEPKMEPLILSQLPGWEPIPKNPDQERANRVRAQAEILQRVSTNLAVALQDSESSGDFELLRYATSRVIKRADESTKATAQEIPPRPKIQPVREQKNWWMPAKDPTKRGPKRPTVEDWENELNHPDLGF